MIPVALAVAALLAALVAVLLLVRDRRRHAREVTRLQYDVAALELDLQHHLNTSARWSRD